MTPLVTTSPPPSHKFPLVNGVFQGQIAGRPLKWQDDFGLAKEIVHNLCFFSEKLQGDIPPDLPKCHIIGYDSGLF